MGENGNLFGLQVMVKTEGKRLFFKGIYLSHVNLKHAANNCKTQSVSFLSYFIFNKKHISLHLYTLQQITHNYNNYQSISSLLHTELYAIL